MHSDTPHYFGSTGCHLCKYLNRYSHDHVLPATGARHSDSIIPRSSLPKCHFSQPRGSPAAAWLVQPGYIAQWVYDGGTYSNHGTWDAYQSGNKPHARSKWSIVTQWHCRPRL